MADDNNSELLALVGDLIRATDRQTDVFNSRFERLNEVMVDGFGRLEEKISGTNDRLDHLTERVDHLTERVDHLTERVDHLTERVDHLTEEVQELKSDVRELKTEMREVKADIREIKTQNQETNRRLVNTFDHVGELTEQTGDNKLRLSHVEQAQQPTNAELDARLRAVEEQLRHAS